MFGSKRVIFFVGILAMVLAAGSFAFADAEAFTVPLTPGQGAAYSPSGLATFALSADGKSLGFKVDVQDVHDFTIAVLEDTPANMKDGEIVAWLSPTIPTGSLDALGNPAKDYYSTQDSQFSISGTVADGVITSSNLVGPLAGKSMSDLLNDIKAGRVYVSIQSVDTANDALTGTLK
jgi:hypothetical protein